MMLYPDVQAKAQEELDRVVGRDRLPDESDDAQLHYVKALSWEIFRWRSVAPMAAPHKSTADDEYRGMFIPKGSLLLPNVWSVLGRWLRTDSRSHPINCRLMLRNNYGPDPEEFRPERFLKKGGIRDPTDVAFGFGRR
jgi:cytochrome P450